MSRRPAHVTNALVSWAHSVAGEEGLPEFLEALHRHRVQCQVDSAGDLHLRLAPSRTRERAAR